MEYCPQKYIRKVFQNKHLNMHFISLPRSGKFKKGDYVVVKKLEVKI